jgi:hypothetical protein
VRRRCCLVGGPRLDGIIKEFRENTGGLTDFL